MFPIEDWYPAISEMYLKRTVRNMISSHLPLYKCISLRVFHGPPMNGRVGRLFINLDLGTRKVRLGVTLTGHVGPQSNLSSHWYSSQRCQTRVWLKHLYRLLKK